MSCGHDLVATAAPPAWKQTGIDLRAVAKRKRWLLWLVLAVITVNLASVLAPALLPPEVSLALLVIGAGVQIGAVVLIFRLQTSLDTHIVARILCAILMFVPCIGLLVLLRVNDSATGALRHAGLKVRLLGVSDAEVVRVLSPNHCTKCGYLLAGNVTGTCPECGCVQETRERSAD